MKLNLAELIERAETRLMQMPLGNIEASPLAKDPRMLEFSFAYPGPLPYPNETTIEEVYSPENMALTSDQALKLYVHLPFCAQRCKFCFYETSIGVREEEIDRYLDTVIKEFDLVQERIGKKPRTKIIYLGGGTPNQLSPEQMDSLLSGLLSRIEPAEGFILNVENHPAQIKEEMIAVYAKHVVNRASMGVQTFREEVLSGTGRNETEAKIVEGYRLLSNCPTIKEINFDIIYSLPRETLNDWAYTLEKIVELQPKELTLYPLKIHPKSHFYSTFQKGELFSQPLRSQLMWRVLADEILSRSGYGLSRPHHYLLGGKSEIGYDRAPGVDLTNYGIGFQIGLGCSAYSHLGEYSYQNQIGKQEYIGAIEKNQISFLRGKKLSSSEKELIFVLGNLCSKRKMPVEDYQRRVVHQKSEFDNKLQELKSLGVVEEKDNQYQLTMAGNLYFDEIGLFLWPEKMRQIYLQECGRER